MWLHFLPYAKSVQGINSLIQTRKDTGFCHLLNHDLGKVTEKNLKKPNQTALPSQTSAFCVKAAVKHVSGKPQHC